MNERNCTVHSRVVLAEGSGQHHGQLQESDRNSKKFRFEILGFSKWTMTANVKQTGLLKVGISCVRFSFSMHAKYHFPSCTTVCVCVHASHHIFRNPIIQRSSLQPRPTALLTTAKCQHRAANTGTDKKPSDPVTSLDLLSPRLPYFFWGRQKRPWQNLCLAQ